MWTRAPFLLVCVAVLAWLIPCSSSAGAVTYPPSPSSLRPGGATMVVSGSRVVDLGSDLSGYTVIDILHGSVEASYSESRRDLVPGGDMGDFSSLGRDDAPGPREDVFGPGAHRSRLHGGVRYILLQGHAVIDKLGMIPDFIQPAAEDEGTFYSSSRQLDRIWQASVETMDLSTARGSGGWVVIDGAKRDRMIWLGDLEMEGLTGSYASRDLQQALDRTLLLFACEQWPDGYVPMALYVSATCEGQSAGADGPVPVDDPRGLLADGALPAYTPALISAVRDRFEFGGDRRFAWAMLPTLESAVAYLEAHVGVDGLFHDAGTLGWRAFDPPEDVDTYTNASWVEALDDLADIEGALGLPDLAATHLSDAQALSAAVNAHLYDSNVGLYVAGGSDATITQDANVRAVLAGVASDPTATLDRLMPMIASSYGPMTAAADTPGAQQYISPFMSGWQLIAMLDAGQGFAARRLMTSLWGRMVDSDPGTMWEAMGLDGEPFSFDRGGLAQGVTSLAHGWSTAPSYALPAFAVGLRPSAPGWSRWIVAPVPMGLKFAGASVPTPSGTISASWSRSGGKMIFDVNSPPGTSGEVISPCGRVYHEGSGSVRQVVPDSCRTALRLGSDQDRVGGRDGAATER